MTTSTTGTGTITLGSAVAPWLTFSGAGVTNGQVVSYGIYDAAGGNSETGIGTYTSSGTTLTRTVTTSTNSNNAINLSGSAEVYITARAQDIGSLIWLSSNVSSSSASSNFTAIDTNTYPTLVFVLRNIVPATNLANLQWQVGTGGTPTYQTSNYVDAASTGSAVQLNPGILGGVPNTAGLGVSGAVVITSLGSTSNVKGINSTTMLPSTALGNNIGTFQGYWNVTGTAGTAVRFLFSSGNISTGTISMYGMKENT